MDKCLAVLLDLKYLYFDTYKKLNTLPLAHEF